MKTNELKRYDAYKPSGVEWLGEIPEHWEIFRIKNITNVFSRGATPEYVENSDYRIVNQATFSKGYFDWGNAKFTSEKSVSNTNFAKAKIQKNDILLASTGGGVLGKVCHFELDADNYYADSHVTILRLCSYELSRFIYYLLSVNYNLINGILAQGSTNQTELQKSWLGNFLISFPPLSEQTAIAQFLDIKTALIDKAIELKEKQIALLKERRQAIIHQAVTKGLNPDVPMKDIGIEWIGEIPEHWMISKLKYNSTVQSGITLGKSYTNKNLEQVPYLRVANVQAGYFKLEDIATLNLPAKEIDKYLIKNGDILVTEGGDLDKLGRGAVWKNQIVKCLHQNHVFAIRMNSERLDPEYVSLLMESDYGRKYFTNTANKTTNLASTNSTKLGNFPLILPPGNERDLILDFIQNTNIKININIGIKEQEIEKLKEYKASLINSAVTGKIKVD